MSKITTTKIKNSETNKPMTETTVHQTIDKIIHVIEKNAGSLALGFAGLLIGCGLYFAYSLYSENSALKKFDGAYIIEKQISDFSIAETDTSDKIKVKKTPETDAVEFNDINSKVVAFVKANPTNGASRNLVLKWSSYLYSVDKFDMAYETLSLLNLKKSNSLEALSVLAKASASVQVGKLAEAIELYKSIIATAKWKFVHPEARFQMSLALIENNKEAEAIENLKTIQIEYPKQRKTVEESTKIMRWLKYKKNEGEQN